MIRYKLTDEKMQTYYNTQWGIGIERITSGKGELCGSGWLHCYSSPLLAILLNPIHANFSNPRLFKCRCKGKHKKDNGLKEGFSSMTLKEEQSLPAITITQKAAFALLCALKVYKEASFVKWARGWLIGEDRTGTAAVTAAEAAARATAGVVGAAWAAAWAAARAAEAAARATAGVVGAAWAAARAAEAAAGVAVGVAAFDLTKLAKKAMKYA